MASVRARFRAGSVPDFARAPQRASIRVEAHRQAVPAEKEREEDAECRAHPHEVSASLVHGPGVALWGDCWQTCSPHSTARPSALVCAPDARRRPRSRHERRHPDRDDARLQLPLRAHDRGDAGVRRAGTGPPHPRRRERLRAGLARARGARRVGRRRGAVGAHDGVGATGLREAAGDRRRCERRVCFVGARLVGRAAIPGRQLRRRDLQGRHRPLRPPRARDRRDGARRAPGRTRGAGDRELRVARMPAGALAGRRRDVARTSARPRSPTLRRAGAITSRATTSA